MTLVGVGLAVALFFYLRHRWRAWQITRRERVKLRALGEARVHRPVSQRILSALPGSAIRRLFRWRPERIRPTVRVARRGLLGGSIRIRPDQHILAVGMTGSGKSSTLRVLASYAIRHPRWTLEVWDGKWGVAGRLYRGKARVLTDLDEIEARLADLVHRELPLRAQELDPAHLALVLDETRLIRQLSEAGLRRLITVVETGRELGVHVWFGLQDPKAEVLPTAIRDQFSCKLAHRVQTAEAAHVVFKDAVAAGWAPHLLSGPGQVLVWEALRRPRVAYALWLAERELAALPLVGPVVRPEFEAAPVALVKASDRPSVRAEIPAQAPARTPGRTADALTDRQAQALMVLDVAEGPMGAADLARELGIERNRAHEVLAQLRRRGLIAQAADGFTIPNREERDHPHGA
ncbi:helix-turn-helix domain-containing protein [Streptomyces sp. 1222.5]|uniref:helix-turn-helix domain-containing protein n=1 Tax=Streptomyces sp. 1222.5 TaxID=1881026 RepID=UPI003D714C8D